MSDELNDEQLDAKINELTAVPEVAAMLDNVAAEAEPSDEELDAEIEKILESPDAAAMLENVAADREDDEVNKYVENFDAPVFAVTQAEFEEFKARVEKAFKHAGFKF